jgi:threonine 3-dehydrogenase
VSGKSVAIFGDGPIGVFAVAVARAYGATNLIVVGKHQYRIDLMKPYEPDHVVNAATGNPREEILDITKGAGVDVVLEMTGSPSAVRDGLRVVRKGGTFTAFGIPSQPMEIDLAEDVVFKGVNIIAINGRKMFETWVEVGNLLNSKNFDVSQVITHEFPLEKIGDAMEILSSKERKVGKVVLKP